MENIKFDSKLINLDILEKRINFVCIINGQKFEYFKGIGHIKHLKELNKTKKLSGKDLLIGKVDLAIGDRLKVLGRSFDDSDPIGVLMPELTEVLNCLFLDSQAHDQSFDDWASDFGYDSDRIKAKKIYEACQENYFKLKKALGSDFDRIKETIEKLEL